MSARKIVTFLLIIAALIGFYLVLPKPQAPEPLGLDTASPALGEAVANAIHQAVTDPYFQPLEKLAAYLTSHPQQERIRVDMLAKWSPDNEFPTAFVRDLTLGVTEIDHPASPWALELVVEQVERSILKPNPQGLLEITTFTAEGEEYWLGYMRIPYKSARPVQVAGVFFSIDGYLEQDAPRFLNEMTNRQRFPIVPFQQNVVSVRGEAKGHIAFRILDQHGEVYYQRGQTFDDSLMIYSESRYYRQPIVCLQEGWDLQLFSSKATVPPPPTGRSILGIFLAMVLLLSLFYWMGVGAK